MRPLLVLAGALASACYSPHVVPGSPCKTSAECPGELVCDPATSTCERSPSDGMKVSDATGDAKILIDGCSPSHEICGDGIDQDCNGSDPGCPVNDAPGGAIDVTGGGTFQVDVNDANADAPSNGCGNDGGRDAFYKVVLTDSTVFYFDTFGSSFDSVIRVYPGDECTSTGTSPECSDDECNSDQSQLAVSLPAGTSCVIVAQDHPDATSGAVTLKVINSGKDGYELPAPVGTTSSASGDTCPSTSTGASACEANNATRNDDYFFTTCGTQTVDVDLCTAAGNWDTVGYVQAATGAEIKCNDDGNACAGVGPSYVANAQVNGPGLFWAGVAGYDPGSCGGYTIEVIFN